eukprot:gene26591-36251_t
MPLPPSILMGPPDPRPQAEPAGAAIDLRAGLRIMIEQLVSLKPRIELGLGILTAAAPCYAVGARRLIGELVCGRALGTRVGRCPTLARGMERDPFDFAIANDRNDPGAGAKIADKKDLKILQRDMSRVILFDDNNRVVHRDCRANTVITPEFTQDPKGRAQRAAA